jgi:hypothetical protein
LHLIFYHNEFTTKAFSLQEKMDILAQMDAYKETHVALPARLGIVPSTLNTCSKQERHLTVLHAMWQIPGSKEERETVPISRTG